MANAKTQIGVVAVLGVVAAAVLTLVMRGGCSPQMQVAILRPLPDPASTPHTVNIDVFIDGSGSISSFLKRVDKDTRPNHLRALLGGFENALGPGDDWQSISPHFFLFGDKVVPAPNTPAFLSEHPEAFHMGTTHIETAIGYKEKPNPAPEPPAELKIIVTDLYEDQNETSRVAKTLASFLQPSADGKPAGAVGVLGFRNPFSGPVMDLSSAAPGKLPDAADSMPFYILLAGSSPDVRHGIKALLNVPALHSAANSGQVLHLLFDRQPQPHARTSPTIVPKSFTRRETREDIEMIALSGDPIQATWKDLPPAPDHTVLLGTTLKSRIVVQPAVATDAVSACEPVNVLCVKIDPRRFDKPGTYLIRLDLEQAEPNDILVPGSDTLANWNIEREDADRIALSKDAKVFPRKESLPGQHPGLTPGLSELLRALQRQMFDSPVPLSSYYLYVQAK